MDSAVLQAWVEQRIASNSQIECESPVVLNALSGDAGFRQYFRVNSEPSLLAVMAPQTDGVSESAEYFAHLSSVFQQYQISTPKIIACDPQQNFLLIESFGDQSLLDELAVSVASDPYTQSLETLLHIQQVPVAALSLPEYDQALLLREMGLFPEWFIGELLNYSLTTEEQADIERAFCLLVTEALEQPQVLVHRDYHSRNLMYREGLPLGVIDFQDAVWGPVTYDLVSLLRDCYVRWPVDKVRQWALEYMQMAVQQGVIPAVAEDRFVRWFDMMGLQRHIKVLGIFARLYLRDGKSRYLADLPLVMRYVLEVAHQYPETQSLAIWFEERLLPLAQQQGWYQPYQTAGDIQNQ